MSLLQTRAVLLDSTVVATREQIACDLAGETVILNLKSGVYFGLDAIGSRIWNLMQNPNRVDEIRDTLLTEYDVEADRCEEDLLALLEDLVAHGLIEVKGKTSA